MAARLGIQTRIQAAAALELRRRERMRARRSTAAHPLPPWTDAYRPPSRYKVAWGGRGSAKSWSFARMLLLRAAERPIRVLCARELQISIKDSVHRLLADQVDALGLSDTFEVGQSFLRGLNGSEFIFKGLRHNAAEIKSMEGIDIAWVEEAQAVSDDSWQLLIPTIRAPGSEIWVTFNPDQESDPTYQRFVVSPPEHAIVQKINLDMNPWFPPELELERAYMARTDPDAYAHVWLGECRTRTDAQVLGGKWVIDCFEPDDGWDGPYYGADWGFAQDPTVLTKSWIHMRRLYVEHEAWGVEVSLNDTPELFDRVPGARNAVVRADSARPETISHVRDLGYDGLTAAIKWAGSVEDGIAYLRSFEQIVIHERCKHTADEARLWSYKTDRLTGDVLPALKDGNDHCIAEGQLVVTRKGSIPIERVRIGDDVWTRGGWRQVVDAWQASPSRDVWCVKAGGNTLIATPDHKVFTINRGFVRVDALRYADVLLSEQHQCLHQDPRRLSIRERRIGVTQMKKRDRYGFTFANQKQEGLPSTFTEGFTSIISERSRKGTTSTTKTATPETTRRKTWNACQSSAMCESTSLMRAGWPSRITVTKYARFQRRGTPAMKGANFTKKLAEPHTKIMSQEKRRASNAAGHFLRKKRATPIYSAATPASLHGADNQALITRRGFARIVARRTSTTNTKKPKLVRVSVEAVFSLNEKRAVYDLTVDGWHEFVAGGLLVSNCFDSIRYALATLIRQRRAVLHLDGDAMPKSIDELEALLPGVDRGVIEKMADTPTGTCRRCSAFNGGHCEERNMRVAPNDPGCLLFVGS